MAGPSMLVSLRITFGPSLGAGNSGPCGDACALFAVPAKLTIAVSSTMSATANRRQNIYSYLLTAAPDCSWCAVVALHALCQRGKRCPQHHLWRLTFPVLVRESS